MCGFTLPWPTVPSGQADLERIPDLTAATVDCILVRGKKKKALSLRLFYSLAAMALTMVCFCSVLHS